MNDREQSQICRLTICGFRNIALRSPNFKFPKKIRAMSSLVRVFRRKRQYLQKHIFSNVTERLGQVFSRRFYREKSRL